ncbi:MAG TPA: DinB family protein [Candidatus Saccharimonadales bacterium]|nr:DinB family protein [Candidatus Saccharimonadales bacterium]
MPAPEIAQLLEILDRGFDQVSWHGPNLRGSLRGLTAEQAAWRPGPGRHNAWEIAVHCAYWKYVARRRLLGGKRGAFPLQGSDWIPRPAGPGEATAAAWRADLRLLEETHRALRAAVAALKPGDLPRRPPGSKVRNRMLLAGIAAHDLYHAGQVQLLKRLRKSR